jgi:hypothetical protein
MREGHGAVRGLDLQPLLEFLRRVSLDDRARFQVAIEYRIVAMRAGMDLVARKHREGAGLVGGAQFVEVARPARLQPGESLDVVIDDVGNTRIVDRHVRPVGMTGNGHEIELPFRPLQRPCKAAVTVGNAAMIVQVAVEGAQRKFRRQRRQPFGQTLTSHVDALSPFAEGRHVPPAGSRLRR